jgi:hypothetical protein
MIIGEDIKNIETFKGTWITLVNIQNLSLNAMSILSDILFQLNQSKDSITINKEVLKITNKLDLFPVYFSTVNLFDQTKPYNSNDTLRIKKIDHVFSRISKDLLDKFRIISITMPDYKLLISSMLIANGFKNYEILSNQIYNLINMFNINLKCYNLFSCKVLLEF